MASQVLNLRKNVELPANSRVLACPQEHYFYTFALQQIYKQSFLPKTLADNMIIIGTLNKFTVEN